MLGDLTAATYQFGYVDSKTQLERAEELGRKAVALDPNSQAAQLCNSGRKLVFHRADEASFSWGCEALAAIVCQLWEKASFA